MKSVEVRFNHVAVHNRSRKEAELFYGRILGLDLVYTFTVPADLAQGIFGIPQDLDVFVFGKGDFRIEVFTADAEIPVATAINHICFEIRDRDSFLERCQKEGLDINRIQREQGITVFIKDFNGNLFEIKERQ